MTSSLLKTDFNSPEQDLWMLESKFCSNPAISLLFRWLGGWGAGWVENKANSVQFQLKLPVLTELENSYLLEFKRAEVQLINTS